jgi:hypothetical protein
MRLTAYGKYVRLAECKVHIPQRYLPSDIEPFSYGISVIRLENQV